MVSVPTGDDTGCMARGTELFYTSQTAYLTRITHDQGQHLHGALGEALSVCDCIPFVAAGVAKLCSKGLAIFPVMHQETCELWRKVCFSPHRGAVVLYVHL